MQPQNQSEQAEQNTSIAAKMVGKVKDLAKNLANFTLGSGTVEDLKAEGKEGFKKIQSRLKGIFKLLARTAVVGGVAALGSALLVGVLGLGGFLPIGAAVVGGVAVANCLRV